MGITLLDKKQIVKWPECLKIRDIESIMALIYICALFGGSSVHLMNLKK
jgi:hypothetical protein